MILVVLRFIKFFILLIPLPIFIFIEFFHPISSAAVDLGYYLKIGEVILKTKTVPNINLFSYTFPHYPFINPNWLSEVIFYLISISFGFSGLMVISTIVVIVALMIPIIYALKYKKVNSIADIYITFLLLAVLLTTRLNVKPEMFSYLFTSLFIAILYLYKSTRTKWIYLLPFLELLWVNMHIYFIIGPVVVFFFLLDSFFKRLKETGNGSKAINTQKTKLLLIIFILVAGATLFNPSGINGGLYPFTLQQNLDRTITENQSIFTIQGEGLTPFPIILFEISAIFLFLSLYLNRKKAALVDWLIAIVFFLLAESIARNIGLYVYAVFIPLCTNFSTSFEKLSTTFSTTARKIFFTALWICIIFVYIFELNYAINIFGFGLGIMSKYENGVNFFLKERLRGPIFNNFNTGGYLEYRLYPQEKVFIDSRGEAAYPLSFSNTIYLSMQKNPQIFQSEDNIYHFNTIIYDYKGDPLAENQSFMTSILKNKNWQLVYLDDALIILVKKRVYNSEIISNFSISEKTFNSSQYFDKNIPSLINIGYFLNTVGWRKPEMTVANQILRIDPQNCSGLLLLSNGLQSNGQIETASIYYEKFQQLCN